MDAILMDTYHCAAELLIVVCQWFGNLETKDLVDGFSANYYILIVETICFSRNKIAMNICD